MAKMSRRRSSETPSRVGGSNFGNEVFDPKLKTSKLKTDWNRKKLPLVGQLVPFINDMDDDGRIVPASIAPYRDGHSTKEDPWKGLTNFFARAPVARIGTKDNQQTFIVCDELEPNAIAESYYGILYNRVDQAVRRNNNGELDYVKVRGKKVNPANWNKYLPGERKNFKMVALPKPSKLVKTFFGFLPLIANGEFRLKKGKGIPGSNAGDYAQILEATSACADALAEALATRKPEFEDNTDLDSIDDAYLHGDVTQLDGSGKWVIIYNPDHHDISRLVGSSAVSTEDIEVDGDDAVEYDPDADGDDDDSGGFGSYKVVFTDAIYLNSGGRRLKYTNQKIIGEKVDEKQILTNYRNIWEYPQLLSPDEQAIRFAKAFRDLPELLLYGFADTPEFFTDEVEAFLAARVQVAAAATEQPADEDADEFDEFAEYDDDENGSVIASDGDDDVDDDDLDDYVEAESEDEPPAEPEPEPEPVQKKAVKKVVKRVKKVVKRRQPA